MKLTRASTYAFYGLAYIAGQSQGRLIPLSEIFEHYGVPEKHLAKIFQSLVKGGILRSARGVNGGFALARPAREISPLDVIEILEGPVAKAGCLLLQEPCEQDTACRINAVWRRAQRAMVKVLREATLADMADAPIHTLRPPRDKIT